MKFFIDTANLAEIREAKEFGLVDGVTTNPSLFAKESENWRTLAEKICQEIEGPVSLEVVGTTAKDMVQEARELVKIGPNVVVKIPMLLEGMKAVKILKEEGIETNVTLCFSPLQALMAAKAGASYISPFVGRLDDMSSEGMELVEQIMTIYGNYNFATQVLVASIRNPVHILQAALLGADVATVPFGVFGKLAKHPLTDIGLEKFLADWENAPKK
ncbi:fructose-6-phosphate aldolase [Desulfobaculum bizertense]|uniref:Probable transaldolase n=1 Tax=Desulfobaculum bizertense DSM 18034 TaxID=1121442 RepID=A0A1T4W2A5_9BACT|nr:fructose-6-phosphate aldolase [Desulfobaculum bizertense]SKA71188.1 transaldolase [Desulfobaculum bizertense DSM 18034]